MAGQGRQRGFLALAVCIGYLSAVCAAVELELLHEFTHVDYDWDAFPVTRAQALESGAYNPHKVTVTGVKQWKDTLYVTTPRWLDGVPATLNTVVRAEGGTSVLRPYPDYASQVIGDSSRLQYIQSMEIDRRGWMWIIDIGRVGLFEDGANSSGPPKLWIWDIEEHRLVHEYVFPEDIASHATSFLNDIFVDDVRNVAYISESSGSGALLVYDYDRNVARRWAGHPSLASENPLPAFTVEGFDINRLGPLPVDGLALAPTVDRVFFTPIHGLRLYSVSAALLRDFATTDAAIAATVMDHGLKTSQCDGLTVSEQGRLFMTMLLSNSVHSLDTAQLAAGAQADEARTDAQDSRLLWPDTFGWATDAKGGLLVSSARLETLFLGDWPSTRVNTALFRVPVDARSYQYALGPLTQKKDEL